MDTIIQLVKADFLTRCRCCQEPAKRALQLGNEYRITEVQLCEECIRRLREALDIRQ